MRDRFSTLLAALILLAPAGTAVPMAATVVKLTSAVPPAEPVWPQPFEVGAGEQTGFGFVAGKPGPIVVIVQWTGVPLTVSLLKPGGGSIDQPGLGSVTLRYTSTAEDVKKGMVWGVNIRPTQGTQRPVAVAGIRLEEKPIKIDTKGVAKGTVNVQHPPGDVNLAQAELKARQDRAQALQPKVKPPATAGAGGDVLPAPAS